MKRNHITKIVLTVNMFFILSLLSGCTQNKNNLLAVSQPTNATAQDSNSFNTSDPSTQNKGTDSSIATPKKAETISLIDSLLTKSSNVQASSQDVYISTEDEFYKIIVSEVRKGEELTVKLSSNIEKENIGDRIIEILESSGYSGYISGIEYNLDGNTLSLSFKYKGDKDEFLSKIKVVDMKVQEIVDKLIKPEMSDFDKELVIHNYLVNNTSYDYDNLKNNTLPDDSFTAYGVLIKGSAVCSGYAEAMYRLLNSAGVNTLIITGTADGVEHAWNIVNIGGSYYHLDATFDDPVSDLGSSLNYNYFNITDSEISKDHVWNTENYPKCTSNTANYFVHSNLVANNKTDFYKIVKEGLLNKQSVIRVKTPSYNTSIFSPNIINSILKDNSSINYLNTKKGFSYNYSAESAIMEFYISYK